MQIEDDANETVGRGIAAGLTAAIGELTDVLIHQSGPARERLQNVLTTLHSLKELAVCVSVQGDKDPAFRALFDEWRKDFRARRKKKFKNLELLDARTGLAKATLRAIETGHRIPTRGTMTVLLATPELDLDKNHIFVQIVLNR